MALMPIEIGFLHFVRSLDAELLQSHVEKVYTTFSEKHKVKNVAFGESGCKEFVAALLLAEFDKNVVHDIAYGINQVFSRNWGPLDFSDYMDYVINEKAIISYPVWSETYRHVENNHKWVENHMVATSETIVSKSNPLNDF